MCNKRWVRVTDSQQIYHEECVLNNAVQGRGRRLDQSEFPPMGRDRGLFSRTRKSSERKKRTSASSEQGSGLRSQK